MAQTRLAAERTKRIDFLKEALSQLNVPYVWGGASTNGFDCSGLVQWAAARVGVQLPHNAADQFNTLPSVSKPMAGDIVFFDVPGDNPAYGQPAHVGICANAGCSMMVNAPAPGGVVDVVPTNPAGWGTIAGYGTLVGSGGLPGTGNPSATSPNPNPPKKGSTKPQAAVTCGHKGNVFGEGGLPIIHTGSFSFTYCELKALLGGLLVGVGGITMFFGISVLVVSAFGRPVAQTITGATPAGVVTRVVSAPQRKIRARGDADDRRAKVEEQKPPRTRRDMPQRTSREGAPRMRRQPVSSRSRREPERQLQGEF